MSRHVLSNACRLAAAAILLSSAAQAQMTLTSSSMVEGGTLPQEHVADRFGCDGENISPQLTWANAPEGTKSFIVLAFDPDAPTASGWWHWGAYDIDSTILDLPAGADSLVSVVTTGLKRVENDFGAFEYIGACPPEGDGPHRYMFTVYAMPMDQLPLRGSVSPAMLSFFGENHALDAATLTVTYER